MMILRLRVVLGLALTLAVSSAASAATYTWDANTTVSGAQDGSGTWDAGITANWWGTSADQAWSSSTTADIAVFGAASGTAAAVTVNGTVYAGGLTFSAAGTGNYSLTSGTINFGGTNGTITVATGVAPTIATILAGSGGMTKAGSGLLILTGSEIYTGTTTVSGGTLQLGDGLLNNGSVLGGLAIGTTVVFANPTAMSYSGAITGGGSLIKTGSATLTLTDASNTGYSGAVDVAGGTLSLGASAQYNQLINATSITIEKGTTLGLDLTGGSAFAQNINALTIKGGTLAGVTNNVWGSWILNGVVTVAGGTATSVISSTNVGLKGSGSTFNVSPGAASGIDLDVTGAIGTAGAAGAGLTKLGSGVMRMSGVNTFTGGLTVNAGTLVLDLTANNSVMSSASLVAMNGGTLELNGRSGSTLTQNLSNLTAAGLSTVAVNNNGGTTTLAFGTLNMSATGAATRSPPRPHPAPTASTAPGSFITMPRVTTGPPRPAARRPTRSARPALPRCRRAAPPRRSTTWLRTIIRSPPRRPPTR